MSKEMLSQVKETIKELSLSEREDLVKYLLSQEAKKETMQEKPKQRVFGLYPGGWISEDFNEPLPDDFWLGESNRL